ncbi:hypothetical protein FNV43_RR24423 [Rhamnella rubrinervis]|uniref:HMA domain-containing protein n=1 Tax=Rhamnella rubrinervis TaxID=2594499 RepID=A0A8K0DR56_9ROSA|nr:hypothetical protein FNV43_RR24423 [Rhamnella rubrinervis]
MGWFSLRSKLKETLFCLFFSFEEERLIYTGKTTTAYNFNLPKLNGKRKPHIRKRSSPKIFNVVELKVGLHCAECIKKILKAIKKIEADIETYNVDTQLNKVIVTGNVTTEQVIKVLQKIGKTASTWEADETH